MKYVLLTIFVLFAAQPLQASLCDTGNDQGTAQGTHGDMHHGDMHDMDCCDHNPADANDSCGSMSHCGACTASAVALNLDMAISVYTMGSRQYLSDTGEPIYRFRTPPFRPPIA